MKPSTHALRYNMGGTLSLNGRRMRNLGQSLPLELSASHPTQSEGEGMHYTIGWEPLSREFDERYHPPHKTSTKGGNPW